MGLDISTGEMTPAADPVQPSPPQPPVAGPTRTQPYRVAAAPDLPVRDTAGERDGRLAAGKADITTALGSAMAAEDGRRDQYGQDILPEGTSYGDAMDLPPVPGQDSKHTGGPDTGYPA
jgi:hypothetical protein